MSRMPSRRSDPRNLRLPSILASSLIAGLSLAVLMSARNAGGATIQGFVLDEVTQAPISNAWVCYAEVLDNNGDGIHQAVHAVTDASGHYSLTMPSEDAEWMACASAPGYANAAAMSVAVAANQDFGLHAAPGSLQFWGRLYGAPGELLAGTPIYSDLDEVGAVAVTDELGRFPYVVEQNVVVPLTIMSNALGIHRYEVDIEANVPMSSPSIIEVALATPKNPVLTDVTQYSDGGGAPIGTELSMLGVDSNGEVVFQATESMESVQVHTSQFEVPNGLSLQILAKNELGWGVTEVSTPHAGPIPVSINDLGMGSISARIIPQVGMPDPGKLVLEVVSSAQGTDLVTPLREAIVTPGATILWGQLPAGTYRLRHTSSRFDRLVDEIELASGGKEARSYVAHKVPEASHGLGTGTGALYGNITAPLTSTTTISIFLTDPIDGRIQEEATADAGGNFGFPSVPAGDWFLHAEGVHDSGMEFRLLEGAIRVSITTGQAVNLPAIGLTESIGLAFRAYGYDYEDGSIDDPVLFPLDTYTVSLYDSQGLVKQKSAGGFHLLAIGSVPPSVSKIVVDGSPMGSKTISIDLTGVDPLTHFQVYDIVVN